MERRAYELLSGEPVRCEVRRQVDVQVDAVNAAPHARLADLRKRPLAGGAASGCCSRRRFGWAGALMRFAAEPAAAVAARAKRCDGCCEALLR